MGEYLDHIHIKNARWVEKEVNDQGVSVWNAEWCPLKKGQVDFIKLFADIKAIGYDGWLSFEDFSNEAGTDEKLKYNLEYIKSIVQEK